jgi:type II secretory pathway component PulF
MPVFKYEGKTRTGAGQKGEIEAADQNAAITLLRRQGSSGPKSSQGPRDQDSGMQPKIGRTS